MVVTPKQQYRYLPISGDSTFDQGDFPYYSTTATTNCFEPLNVPIDVSITGDYGMTTLPNPKKYNVHYDDVKNLCTGKIGMDTGSFSFLINKRFDYDENITTLHQIPCNDDLL